MTAPSGRTDGGTDSSWRVLRDNWRKITVRTWREIDRDNVSLLAAGVAFYSFLAFVPLLASVVLIYGLAADPIDAAEHARALLKILPADAAQIVGEQLDTLSRTPAASTALGLVVAIVLALYGAMRASTSIIGALNVAYGEKETRGFIRTSLLSFALTGGTALVGVMAIVAVGAMSLIGTLVRLPPISADVAVAVPWLATALVVGLLIGCVYRFGPNHQSRPWRQFLPGIVLASVGSLLATFLFGLYVSQFGDYNATYGALGAVVSFLMWLYISAFVVLVGAELNSEIERCAKP